MPPLPCTHHEPGSVNIVVIVITVIKPTTYIVVAVITVVKPTAYVVVIVITVSSPSLTLLPLS